MSGTSSAPCTIKLQQVANIAANRRMNHLPD
jgi:hypothetical protein